MAIIHKFKEKDFGNGFKSKDAILVETPYKPEILFIGTFNPSTDDKSNVADFFYGRNWFWPILFYIFVHKDIVLQQQRKYSKKDFNPTLHEIFQFMKEHKITFADLIMQVFDVKDDYTLAANKIIYNENYFDLINDSHLSKLDKLRKVHWNDEQLIAYIKENSSIKTIYFTRKSVKPFDRILHKIEEEFKERNLKVKYLFTPSGQGMKGKPRINQLVNQWKKSERDGFDSLDEKWLQRIK